MLTYSNILVAIDLNEEAEPVSKRRVPLLIDGRKTSLYACH